MEIANLPPKQGLYDPRFEHDACGVGFVVNIKGEKSHEIVDQALTVLQNLDHRGACGCEENTGDGVHGNELWVSDGTTAGTYLVADLNPGSAGAAPFALTDVEGTLYFVAFTPGNGRELY